MNSLVEPLTSPLFNVVETNMTVKNLEQTQQKILTIYD